MRFFVALHSSYKTLTLHFPVTISIGQTHILLHTITDVLGLFIGFRYYIFLKKRQGDVINSPNRLWIVIAATLGGFIGSRLLGGLENPVALKNAISTWQHFYTNKTIVGGLIGGLISVEFMKKMIHEKTASGDLFTLPILLALLIGRIGCFSMGVYEDAFGVPTALPWGLELGDGIARHPVCLYEIAFLLFTWRLMVWLNNNYPLANGARFKIFMILYCTFRFLLDFIKPHYTYATGLSAIQLCCVTTVIYYYPYILYPKKLLVIPQAIK